MSTRQIKFRAWDATHKKMHHKVLIGNTVDKENYTANSIYIMPSDVDYEIPESGQWMHFDENSNIYIMQFTGLVDKTGNEIYEGDISMWSCYYGDEEVVVHKVMNWDKEGAFFEWVGEEMPEWSYRGIVGNIYETPELIKQKAR